MVSKSIVRTLLWSISGWQLADACGVLVHNEVFRRAQYIYKQPVEQGSPNADLHDQIAKIISDPARAKLVQAGAFFPDWGYGCFGNDAPSEDAHWPPFLVASVNYITKKYGPIKTSINNEQVKDLIAFLYAVSSHQAADASWHSLSMTNGIMQALAGIDFNGDYNAAHSQLDVGGDIVFANRLAGLPLASKSWVEITWKVPIDDLLEIYKTMGRNINKIGFGICAYRGLAAILAEVVGAAALYIPYANKSPGMLDMVDNYYLGGVEEMSAGAAYCWGNLTNWFADGGDTSGKNGGEMCDVFKRATVAKRQKAKDSDEHNHNFIAEASKNPEFFKRYSDNLSRVKQIKDEHGSVTYHLNIPPQPKSAATQFKEESVQNAVPVGQRKAKAAGMSFKDPTYISTYVPFSNFGQQIVFGNLSTSDPNTPMLLVGAQTETEFSNQPNAGAIYVVDVGGLVGQSKVHIGSRGASDKNRIKSLAAGRSGPTTSWNDRYGYAVGVWNSGGEDLVAVTAPGPSTFGSNVPAGRLEVYRGADRLLTVQMNGAGLAGTGRRQFGTAFLAADLNGDGEQEIIVAASQSDGDRPGCGTQFGEGQVMVFNLPEAATLKGSPIISLDKLEPIVLTLPANVKASEACKTSTYEWFGETLSFLPKSRLLAIGAPGRSTVYFFKFNTQSSKFDNVFSIKGPDHVGFGGFGLETGVSFDGTEWVAIASPNESTGLLGPQAGKVRLYAIAKDGKSAAQKTEITAQHTEFYGKFGMKIVADPSQGGIWIGSSYAESERGAVWWVDVNGLLKGGQSTLGAEKVFSGPEAKAHFGASLAVADVNGDGKSDLVVGIPYTGVSNSDGNQRFTGAVAAYVRS